MNFGKLSKEIKIAISKIKKENYKNYFDNVYNKEKYTTQQKQSTRKRKPKKYKT
jgi:hypothetical protein